MASKTLLQRFFPIDTIPVVIPVAAAAALFSVMLGRIAVDPDTRTQSIGETAADELYGKQYRNTFKSFFADRIKNGHISIFNNNVQ